MEDNKIIDLYWERNQQAIEKTQEKYSRYCHSIAGNILKSREDCEECVNDTWLRAWNAMPSERPNILSAFLGAITRNLSLDRYRHNTSKKRGGGEVTYIFEELEDCIGGNGVEGHVDAMVLTECLNKFLEQMEQENRVIFVRRYWYMDSIEEITKRFQISESKVKSSLFRSRKKLHTYLSKEGFEV
ncbi:sigma-70 family RNA polymerase sigma factor [Lachnospiraceae bacterium OttesenSCG-928-D06]|nr:sigma-70 family RNA polymerase sigma factor [Lachnospiraceae bacterium OttesenSCG-928-D06]